VAGKRSAGLLLYRRAGDDLEVLLGHMGGPFWARRDARAWTMPKGEYDAEEEALDAARREFQEELGVPAPTGEVVELGEVRQAGGKIVTAWAVEGDLDPAVVVPGTFEMEWPKGSGQRRQFPEVDRVGWFGVGVARAKIITGQQSFLDRLIELASAATTKPPEQSWTGRPGSQL
jgi:predicted NUDIX family NTP pyrophosphohydrolase